jgi:hypothetical protein
VSILALRLVLWLAAGHALAGVAYAALINVPESSLWMLGLSLVLASVALVVASVTSGAVVRVLASGGGMWQAAAQSRGDVGCLVVSAMVFVAFWVLGGELDGWHAARRGEIDAWLISTMGIADSAWLHRSIDALVFVVRAVVGVSAAVAAFVAGVRRGWRGVLRFGWVRGVVSRDQLALTALAVTVLIALPLRALFWRPASLPPHWVEVAVAAIKLAVIYFLFNAGWLVVLLAGVRAAHQREKHAPAAP